MSKFSTYKRAVLVLLVGVTLVLAGCSAGGQSTGSGHGKATRPTGYTKSGIGNVTAAEQSNAAALKSAGTWTHQLTQFDPVGRGTTTRKFDLDAQKIRMQSGTGSLSFDAYLTPNTSMVRTNRNGHVGYSNPFNFSFDATYSYRYVVQNNSLRLCNYTANGTTTLHGTKTFRYSSDTIANRSAVFKLFGDFSPKTYSNTSANLYVDSSGVIRKFTLSTDTKWHNSTKRLHYAYNITDVGDTTVSKPNWASKVPSS